MLTQFIQPAILKGIGHARLTRFFEGFGGELKAANVVLPAPANGNYFDALAAVLAAPTQLPERMRATLFALEEAAAPANNPRLQEAILRRIPRVCLAGLSAVDRALELWFVVPEELSQFGAGVVGEGWEPRTRMNHEQVDTNAHESKLGPEEGNGEGKPRRNTDGHGSAEPEIRNPPAERDEIRDKSEIATKGHKKAQKVGEEISSALANGFEDSGTKGSESDLAPLCPSEGERERSDEETYERLAGLSPAEYDRARQAEAGRLGIRKETLDAEVARRRARVGDDGQGTAVELPSIEPWPEAVDGQETLTQVAARFSLYLVLPRGAAQAMTLWTAHTHAIAAFRQTPRLNLYSPDPGCGKTTTLDVLASMTPRPLRTENLTSPVLFRLVDQHQPTLLLDEVDAYLNQADELRGLLNAGHKRGACAYRCEGESNAVRAFKAFAPAALAGIGALPGTLHDRSIQIPLVEAEPGELAASFDSLHTEVETVLCRKLARWAQDNFAALQSCDPALPATAFNRLADNWRPLFAIAQVAGGDWPRLAAEAFASLSAKEGRDGEGLGRLLLADIRQIFAQRGSDRLSSTQLVDCLCALADRPWREAQQGGKPINEIWLGRRLGRCGVRSHNIRLGDRQAKGYEFGDFAEAFDRLEEGEAD
jgi:putative DNA primase/helicase